MNSKKHHNYYCIEIYIILICFHSCKLGLVTTMSQLMIPNSNFDDSGSYKCEATSEYFENPVSATEGNFFLKFFKFNLIR